MEGKNFRQSYKKSSQIVRNNRLRVIMSVIVYNLAIFAAIAVFYTVISLILIGGVFNKRIFRRHTEFFIMQNLWKYGADCFGHNMIFIHGHHKFSTGSQMLPDELIEFPGKKVIAVRSSGSERIDKNNIILFVCVVHKFSAIRYNQIYLRVIQVRLKHFNPA